MAQGFNKALEDEEEFDEDGFNPEDLEEIE